MTTPKRLPARVDIAGLGLRLREWSDDDLPVMVELFDETEIARWTPLPSPFDRRAAAAYLARAQEARAAGQRLHLAITTDGRAALGEVLLFGTGRDDYEAELGYTVGAAYRRQGLATRAVELLARYAFETLGMRRLLLRIERANTASVAVAHAVGFRLTDDEPVVRNGDAGPVVLHTWCRDRDSPGLAAGSGSAPGRGSATGPGSTPGSTSRPGGSPAP
jgi:RimJ/RimL family protein N-acetyltransferase